MNVLVTGATGFIGFHPTKRLVPEGYRVRALVRPATDPSALTALGVEIARGDIRNLSAVEHATTSCQLVVHLAARTSHSSLSAKETHAINVQGTANVARAAVQAGVSRFVFVSSSTVYGLIKNRAMDECTPVPPHSAYGKSKVQAEQIVLSHYERDRLPIVIARISGVFGPGSKSWLALVHAIVSGRFRLVGTGDNYRHPGDLLDIVEGLLRCSTVQGIEGRTYIITGGEPLLLRDLIRLIQKEVGVATMRWAIPGAPLRLYKLLNEMVCACGGEQLPRFDRVEFFLNDRIFDLSRARTELGYYPTGSIKQAIHRTIEWHRIQGDF